MEVRIKKFKKLCSFGLALVMMITTCQLVYASETDSEEKATDAVTENLEKSDKENTYTIFNEPQQTLQEIGFDVNSQAAVLMEGSTGNVIFSKNETEHLRPASITKIMTLLLIFEALDEGRIKFSDIVSVSEHAASMGGSQVYLEPFETQDVETLIKCISIASANDASVAMAEHIAGSEESFVSKMNQRAKELGMNHTNFVNCYGLDNDNHFTCALDVAIMSRELITKHPQISNYSTVWMDTFVHTTKKGQTTFGLTNTNKLIKSFKGITGLKTGSTSLAKYCLSATAHRDNMDLIAVIMAAPDPKIRFSEAAKLLNYGYANCSLYLDKGEDLIIPEVNVRKGIDVTVNGKLAKDFSYLCMNGVKVSDITKEVVMREDVEAPLAITDVIGEVVYYSNGKEIGRASINPVKEIGKAGYGDYFKQLLNEYL